jgi:hypothetical protein
MGDSFDKPRQDMKAPNIFVCVRCTRVQQSTKSQLREGPRET